MQSTLPVLLDEGYRKRGLSLRRIAAITSWNGAQRFRLNNHNRANFVLVDLNGITEVNEQTLLHRHRTSPYSGLRLRGAIRHTIRRGEVIYSEGAITATSKGILIRPNE